MRKRTLLFSVSGSSGCALLVLVLFLLTGCYGQKKFNKWADDHLDHLAIKCSEHFKPIDSVGAPIHAPANNIDQSAKIDSLTDLLGEITDQLNKDAEIVPDTCKKAIGFYQMKILDVHAEMERLKKSYRPCAPDTIKIPYYRRDVARENALQNELTKVNEQLSKQQERSAIFEESSKNRMIWLSVLGVALLGCIILLFKK